MPFANFWRSLTGELREHRAQLRFCLRITIAALLALGLAQFGDFPLHGLWAVLTAIVVTQISVGASLQATTEYVVGTICGAIYASIVVVLLPHQSWPALTGVMIITIAPLAFAAAFDAKFRVAPFTAVLVLFISNEFHQNPLEAGEYRVLEVLIGGVSAILVSVLILPARSHTRAIEAAAGLLERFAEVMPALLAGFENALNIEALHRLQDDLGAAIGNFQAIVSESKRERLTAFVAESDHGPLSRTLLRLRHDLVILGRAAAVPLPASFCTALRPDLEKVSSSTTQYLRDCAAALLARQPAPPLDTVNAAYDFFAREFAMMRKDGVTRTFSTQEVESAYALAFSFEQLHRDLGDLSRCVTESAKAPKSQTKASKAKTS
jgi:uncharacterized membrane protein YccC